jgi:hypothetical protein
VQEYNDAMQVMAGRFPGRILLVQTERLNDDAAQNAIFDFVGLKGFVAQAQLNAGTTTDGRDFRERYLL